MTNTNWTPAVAFYFRVGFQHAVHGNVSFSEVRGLDTEIEFDEVGYPKRVKHPDLVLIRAMHTVPDDLAKWVQKCTQFDGFIKTCTITVCLMNEDGKAIAVWLCTNAYPKKLSISPFKAKEGKLVIEELTLTYDTLQRKL